MTTHRLHQQKKLIYIGALMILSAIAYGCSDTEAVADFTSDQMPVLYPDYTEVTVAPNLVAPRFWYDDTVAVDAVQAVFESGGQKYVVNGDGRKISLSGRQWGHLTDAGNTVTVSVKTKKDGKWTAHTPFNIYVSPDSIDKFVAYRLIEPGYESWSEMGIYQRCLESYRVDPIITNKQTDYGCMNCHSFCQQSPDKWLLHLRAEHSGTYIIDGDDISKVDTKVLSPITSLVYPSWHPSGDFVAFSTNDTKQMFHTSDPNRIEVYDNASDVVVYDVERHKLFTSPALMRDASFETYPTFSADGKTLYFCSADSVKMPDGYDRLKYNVCSVSFDPVSRTLGTQVDTLYRANEHGGSAAFPRVSPDGRHLMFTVSGYGTFPIWHHDADLYMADLATGDITPIEPLNSEDTESYHSWSHNGRWVVFSSRRIDGLYTRLYIAHIDEQGRASKPLLLPPPTRGYYDRMMKSYNVPEFVEHPVTTDGYDIVHK